MLRLVVRVLLLAVLLGVAYAAFFVTGSTSAPGSASKSASGLHDGYGSTLETRRPEPEPERPEVDVADIEMATALSRLDRNCPSAEVIEYVKAGDLEAFAECLRAGNDPWIIQAPMEDNPRWWLPPNASALYIASARGHLEIVELLVGRYDVSPNWGGAIQNIPLVAAIEGDRYEVVTFLLDAGADTRRWTPAGRTPVSAALTERDTKYLQAVLEAGAFPNDSVEETPLTPLSIAINQRRFEHALVLAENGACVPRDVSSLEDRVKRTRGESEREVIRQLVEAFRENYDPTCKVQNTYEGRYIWEPDRHTSEVEIANPDS